MPARRCSRVRLWPVLCQTRLSMTMMAPAGASSGTLALAISSAAGLRFKRWLPGTMRVAPFSSVKASTHQATFTPCGLAGHGSGTKIWSACRTISPPPGPVMLAEMLPRSAGHPIVDFTSPSASGSSTRSAKTGSRLKRFQTR